LRKTFISKISEFLTKHFEKTFEISEKKMLGTKFEAKSLGEIVMKSFKILFKKLYT
jgi:hypothetical protein